MVSGTMEGTLLAVFVSLYVTAVMMSELLKAVATDTVDSMAERALAEAATLEAEQDE
jgi:hypothetical protein